MCSSKKNLGAIALIIVGLVFLAKNYGWIAPGGSEVLSRGWPAILVVVGVYLLIAARKKKSVSPALQ